MLRAPPRPTGADWSDGVGRGALLSVVLHGAALLGITFDLSFLAPDPDWAPIEVELLFVEPEREEEAPKQVADDLTPLEAEDAPVAVSEQQPRATDLSRRKEPARQISRPRTGELAKSQNTLDQKESRSEEKKDPADSAQSASDPPKPTRAADQAEEEDTSIQEALLIGEVPGCEEGGKASATRTHIDEIAKSATSGRSYAQAAVHAQINGYLRKAIDLYDAAILARDLSQDSLAKVYNNRGAAYRSLGIGGLAIDDYNEAMRLMPNYAAAYFNRGVAFNLNGQQERAVDDFTRSIRLDSGFAKPYYHRGAVYAQQGKHERAISDFSRAIKLAPCLDYAYFDRGRVFESTGDLQRALDDFKKSYALDPGNQDYKTKLLGLGAK